MSKIYNSFFSKDGRNLEALREEFSAGRYLEDMDYIVYLMSK